MDRDRTDEIEGLRAERDELRRELDARDRRRGLAKRGRGVLAAVAVAMTCVLLLATLVGVWARRSFLENEGFTERAGSLGADPEVQAALATYLTRQVNELIDPAAIFQSVLPEDAAVLAIPLGGAVEGFVGDQVATFMASDSFAELWRTVVSFAHERAVRVLEGQTDLLSTGDDRIVINLIPVLNEVLARIGTLSPEVFGRAVTLPTITVDEVPDEARAALGNALGLELDDDFGTFTIYDEGALASAQKTLALTNRIVYVLLWLTTLSFIAALAVSDRRRRTLLQLTIGATLTMILLRRFTLLLQDDLLALIAEGADRGAVQVATDAFLEPLRAAAGWVLVSGLLVAAVAAVTGPYPWAVRVRSRSASAVGAVASAIGQGPRDDALVAWITEHEERLRLGALVGGAVMLWAVDVSWFSLLAIVGAVVAALAAVGRLAERPPAVGTG